MSNTFDRVRVVNKKDPSILFIGYIIWRDSESFGIDFEVYGLSATATCYHDEWEINYNV